MIDAEYAREMYSEGYIKGKFEGYKQGKENAIDEFVDKMRKYYWDSNVQSAKDDPCVIDAMIDLAIRTAKEVKAAELEKELNDGTCDD